MCFPFPVKFPPFHLLNGEILLVIWQYRNATITIFFCLQKLKVLFAVGTDGEVSEPLEVNALDCDTVEQVKEKILSSFKAKFGFPYNIPLKDVCIGRYQILQEVIIACL